ncbi:MAG: family 20 glycosylhydrolase [Kiritimatiellae bacterium]|nr:family 20 glycosylhydrolase [Kiritimatiellia bacterium]
MSAKHLVLTAAVFGGACAPLPTAAAEKFVPVKQDGDLVLFDPATHDPSLISNYTHGGHKGHDLKPVVRPITRDGRKWLEFTYTGKRGTACSTFYFENVPKPAETTRYTGIRFTIDYDGTDYGKVNTMAKFGDGTGVYAVLTLEPGTKDYEFRGGFRRAKHPPDWSKISYMWLSAGDQDGKGNPMTFRLRRAVMIESEVKRVVRKLEVAKIRKTHEIFPLNGALELDGNLRDPAWRHGEELARLYYYHGGEMAAGESPFRVRVAYDREKIYVATQSEFPSRPVARETRRDGSVYGDEAQEFLFSGPNDNRQKVQWVYSIDGVIFDQVTEYDLAAAGIRTKDDKVVKHEKAYQYANGLWTTEIAFPFSELQVDLDKQRYMGFQIAQYYIARKDKKLRTVVWDRTARFPSVPDFGVLVFNKQPFGPGTIAINGIEREDSKDGTATFVFDCTFKGFEPGVYQAAWHLVRDRDAAQRETLSFTSGRETRKTITIAGAENRTSLYSFTLTLQNARGDSRVCIANFQNDTDEPDLFGKRLFTPRLKQIKWLDGEFPARRHTRLYLEPSATARTRKTAALFAETYHAHTGITLETVALSGLDARDGIVLRVARSARYDGKPAEPRREGYCLNVAKNRVLVTGFDEPGLYYGLVTFFQLMKNGMKVLEQMPVPCVDIYDWPDVRHRMVSSQGQSGFRNQTPFDNYGIEYMMEWVDRFVAGSKANVLYWDLSTRVKYKRRPEFNGSERVYSLEDLERFGEFCRDRFVEVCPAWQIGGHANWWLLGYHKELREKGYENQGDVTHPDHNKVVFGCMQDVIEALHCKYLSPKGDEWWGGRKAGESADELLNGKTRAQAFLDFHVELNNWLKRQGVTMLLYHDMLTPYHNGKKFDLYKIADRFPKDVIIQYWGGRDSAKGIQWLRERGFANIWIHSTGSMISLDDETKKLVDGYGKILYSLGNDKLGGLLDEYSHFNNVYWAFHTLDYAWNLFDYKKTEPGREVTIKNIMAVKPNPFAGEKIEPLDISGVLNQSFNAFLKEAKPKDYGAVATPVTIEPGTQELGFIPMRLEPDEKGNCRVLREGAPEVTIPVNGTYSSLLFLHTAFINDPKDKRAASGMSRYWLYGWPCGDYIVHYADGETQKLPVRLTMNIRRFDTRSNNRATNENRYVLAFKDANQTPIHLFQWEWVNPHPEKRIDRVSVRHDKRLNVSLILFAVSGRSVWRPGAQTAGR